MSYQYMFQKAVELHQNGALNEAEQIYRQILETAPENADVLNLLGLVAQSKGIHNEAAAYFYRAVKSAPNHFPIYFNLAVSLGAMGKYVEALEAYHKVIELKADCKEAWLGIGNLYWAQNKIDEAKNAFSEALKTDAQYQEAQTNLAELNNDMELLQKISTNNPQALYYLARQAFNEQRFDKAAEYLTEADALSCDDSIKAMLGEALLANGQKDEALKLFYQAWQLNNHNLTAALNIADIEAERKNFKDAEKFYKKAIELDEKNLRAHANYANMLCHNKRTLEGLEEYRQAVIISPQTPELSYNLALILKSLEEYEQALDLMFHAFYLQPDNTEWSLNIAETLVIFNEKAPEKAKKICENWYEKMPDNVVTKHLWAAMNNKESGIESEYNRLLFDIFAPTYETTLNDIGYQAADKIAELFAPLKGNVLDLGCGTGLLGEKIYNEENHLYGVDISPNMLKVAKEKNIYTELYNEDIIHYLQNKKQDFEWITAADVFCYFGDLKDIFDASFPSKIIFSVESDEERTENFALQPNGRYKHNPEYVKQLLQNAGYKNIETHTLVLRKENNQDVNGLIFKAE